MRSHRPSSRSTQPPQIVIRTTHPQNTRVDVVDTPSAWKTPKTQRTRRGHLVAPLPLDQKCPQALPATDTTKAKASTHAQRLRTPATMWHDSTTLSQPPPTQLMPRVQQPQIYLRTHRLRGQTHSTPLPSQSPRFRLPTILLSQFRHPAHPPCLAQRIQSGTQHQHAPAAHPVQYTQMTTSGKIVLSVSGSSLTSSKPHQQETPNHSPTPPAHKTQLTPQRHHLSRTLCQVLFTTTHPPRPTACTPRILSRPPTTPPSRRLSTQLPTSQPPPQAA